MRIENLRETKEAEGRRVLADVRFEDADREDRTLWIAASGPYAEDLAFEYDAFVLAVLPLAVAAGEARVRVDGDVDTTLARSAEEVVALLAAWSGGPRVARLEAEAGLCVRPSRPDRRAACFFSGGVDSLAALRANRLDLPSDHPASFRDAVRIFGLNTYDHAEDGTPYAARVAAFERDTQRFRPFLEAAGLEPVVLATNARSLYATWEEFSRVGFPGAAVGAAAAFAARWTEIALASDGVVEGLVPSADHPLYEQLFVTSRYRVWIPDVARSRLEKLRLLAQWPEGLQHLNACHHHEVQTGGARNCSRCEKCLRTMLGLAALGALDRAVTFEGAALTPEAVRTIRLHARNAPYYGRDLLDGLHRHGRDDLAQAVRERIARYERRCRRAKRRARWASWWRRPPH